MQEGEPFGERPAEAGFGAFGSRLQGLGLGIIGLVLKSIKIITNTMVLMSLCNYDIGYLEKTSKWSWYLFLAFRLRECSGDLVSRLQMGIPVSRLGLPAYSPMYNLLRVWEVGLLGAVRGLQKGM